MRLLIGIALAAGLSPLRKTLLARLNFLQRRTVSNDSSLPGPVAGLSQKVDLTDPRVRIEVALTDDTDPDGDGPCTGQLDMTSAAARKRDYAITINASFFAAPKQLDVMGRKVRYFVGNCAWPEGWHVFKGKLISKPAGVEDARCDGRA